LTKKDNRKRKFFKKIFSQKKNRKNISKFSGLVGAKTRKKRELQIFRIA